MDAAREYMLRRRLKKMPIDDLRSEVERMRSGLDEAVRYATDHPYDKNAVSPADAVRSLDIAERILGAAEKKHARGR